MAQSKYCWRCKTEVPMLDEEEWTRIGPLLAHSSDPECRHAALDLYEDMTGFRETNINAIWHHRIARYGPPCPDCGRPLRTPKAKFCADCPPASLAKNQPITGLSSNPSQGQLPPQESSINTVTTGSGSRLYRTYEVAAEGCILLVVSVLILAGGTGGTFAILAWLFGSVGFELGGAAVAAGILISAVPPIVFMRFLWIGYKRRRAADLKAKRAAEVARQNMPESSPDYRASFKELADGVSELVYSLFSLALGLALLAIIGFVIYVVVTSISTPLAILLGAVFIGLCILAVAAR